MSGRHAAPERLHVRPRPVLTAGVFAAVAAVGAFGVHTLGHEGFAWYGGTLGCLLLAKLVLALWPPRQWPDREPLGLRVGLVVPVFNEDPAAFAACLASIEGQSRRPDVVVVVDDASTDVRAARVAYDWCAARPGWWFNRLPVNAGKRHAQASAFTAFPQVDVWVTVDSDTVLESSAVREGLRAFHDPTVTAVTGTVLALNPADGALPALIDLRYANAFLGDRAAQSTLGSVLCCCGSLSFWRGDVIREHVGEWSGQTFLGRPATFGDDRRLTRHALDHGRVVLARDSIARTAVPVRVGHYLRQQARWGRSFWRESWLMLTDGSPRRVAWWLTLVEVATTVAFTVGMAAAVVVGPLTGQVSSAAVYAGWVLVTSWARSVHIFAVRGRGPWWRTAVAFAIAPLYGLMSLLVLLPVRVWSLLTLRSSAWGTRAGGVEVVLADRVPDRAVA